VILTDPNSGGTSIGMETGERSLLTYPEFERLRDRVTALSAVCATESGVDRWPISIAGGPQEETRGRMVSEGYFHVFGVQPAIGRFFTEADGGAPGKDPYAVPSYDFWQRRFGGNTSALGTAIRLRRTTYTLIGVAPHGFRCESSGQNPDLWLPLTMQPQVLPGRDWLHENMAQSIDKVMWLHVFGRLKPAMTIARAQSEIDVLFRNIMEAGYPAAMPAESRKRALDQRVVVRDARRGAFRGRDEFSKQMPMLQIVAGLVLLISCANVANLLLARAAARYKEVGVRLSIGAGRSRLVRQFLTESLLLSALGGVAGVLVAAAASRFLLGLLSTPGNPLDLVPDFDLPVLGFTLALTFLTGILFGLAPALRATRVDFGESLRAPKDSVTPPDADLSRS
jgi:predicted permease